MQAQQAVAAIGLQFLCTQSVQTSIFDGKPAEYNTWSKLRSAMQRFLLEALGVEAEPDDAKEKATSPEDAGDAGAEDISDDIGDSGEVGSSAAFVERAFATGKIRGLGGQIAAFIMDNPTCDTCEMPKVHVAFRRMMNALRRLHKSDEERATWLEKFVGAAHDVTGVRS